MLAPVTLAAQRAELDKIIKRKVLANGLEVILHRDPSAPLVVTNLWYHVGSGDETPGKSGFEWSCVTSVSGCGRKHPSHRGEEWLVNVAFHWALLSPSLLATAGLRQRRCHPNFSDRARMGIFT